MIIGTAGHIDHGKTALVRALTGVDTDRLKEEKARGISIDLGFAFLAAPDGGVLGFIDVPGHEKFIHNMLAGATGIDFVLLVVAADDGVMPQTREHLAIVDLLGIERGIVALTKSDVVGADRIVEVAAEIARTVADTGLSECEILPVSSISGAGVESLRNRLFAAAHAHGTRAVQGRFRLAVDRSFVLTGAGTVVTGTILSGQVAVGDQVTISPSGLAARVRSIHVQNRPADRGAAGDRCALNLAGDGISKDAIARGDMVIDPGLHAPTERLDASVRLLATEPKAVTQWMPVRLHHAATEVGARVVLLGDDRIPPGGEALIQLVLEKPIAAAAGDRFVLRDTTAQRTIGGGRFLDLRAPARKRRTPERFAQLDAYAMGEPEQALAALLDRPPYYVELAAFARDRAMAPGQIEQIADRIAAIRVPAPAGEAALSAAHWLRLKQGLLSALAEFHAENPDMAGIGMERLRLNVPLRIPTPIFVSMLQSLSRMHEIALDGAWVRLPAHEVRLTPTDQKVWDNIQPRLAGNERFRPPRVQDLAGASAIPEGDVRRLLKLLARLGKVDEVAPDHFFMRETVGEMVDVACDLAGTGVAGEFNAAMFRDRLDNGRKVAIQILEFFDRHGVTLRRGDLRRMNKQRLDLFRRNTEKPVAVQSGREASPVGRPDFKSGKGRQPVLGGFDSHSLPPSSRRAR